MPGRRLVGWHPYRGAEIFMALVSGGVVAMLLDHRLLAGKPPASGGSGAIGAEDSGGGAAWLRVQFRRVVWWFGAGTPTGVRGSWALISGGVVAMLLPPSRGASADRQPPATGWEASGFGESGGAIGAEDSGGWGKSGVATKEHREHRAKILNRETPEIPQLGKLGRDFAVRKDWQGVGRAGAAGHFSGRGLGALAEGGGGDEGFGQAGAAPVPF